MPCLIVNIFEIPQPVDASPSSRMGSRQNFKLNALTGVVQDQLRHLFSMKRVWNLQILDVRNLWQEPPDYQSTSSTVQRPTGWPQTDKRMSPTWRAPHLRREKLNLVNHFESRIHLCLDCIDKEHRCLDIIDQEYRFQDHLSSKLVFVLTMLTTNIFVSTMLTTTIFLLWFFITVKELTCQQGWPASSSRWWSLGYPDIWKGFFKHLFKPLFLR